MTAFCLPGLLALALLASPPMAAAADPPLAVTAALTEAHNIIGMQYFVVGTLATECQAELGAPESFVRDTQATWQARNPQFLQALTRYQQVLFEDLQARFDAGRVAAEKARFREIIVAQGTALVEQFLSRNPRAVACRQFQQGFEEGYFDITPKFPLYPEAQALVTATTP